MEFVFAMSVAGIFVGVGSIVVGIAGIQIAIGIEERALYKAAAAIEAS